MNTQHYFISVGLLTPPSLTSEARAWLGYLSVRICGLVFSENATFQ